MKNYLRSLIELLGFCIIYNSVSAQNIENMSKEKPFSFSGTINMNLGYYHSNDGNNRYKPFNWYLSGSPVVNIYGISFPFNLTVSDQHTSFSQPFNQYGVSPTYKWISAHLGYRNLNFSNYTLGGAGFLGAGLELNPNKFRFGIMGGRFQKAVEEITTGSFQPIPAYERWGYAMKLGYGTDQNFIDIIGFKGKDKVSSLSNKPTGSFIAPQDNVSLGLRSSFTYNKFNFQLDGAFSALTRDVTNTEAKRADSNLNFITSLVAKNGTTIGRMAGEASIAYSENLWALKLKAKRIEPDYSSLGAYYFQTDVQQFTISPSLKLLKKKLRINTSLGWQTDDLLKSRNYKTRKVISSASLNYNHNSFFSAGINLSNYGTSQLSGRLQLKDSIRLSVVSLTYGGYITLNRQNENNGWSMNLNISKNNFQDNNIVTKAFTETNAFLSGINFSYSLTKKGIVLNGGFVANSFKSSFDTTLYWGPSAGSNFSFNNRKISAGCNLSLNFKRSKNSNDGYLLYLSSSINYAINKHHSVGMVGSVNKNTSSITNSIYSLNEQRINVTYGYTF